MHGMNVCSSFINNAKKSVSVILYVRHTGLFRDSYDRLIVSEYYTTYVMGYQETRRHRDREKKLNNKI